MQRVHTDPRNSMLFLEDAVKAFVWAMPKTDFSIYVEPLGAGVTVVGLNGVETWVDLKHPGSLADAVREAMLKTFHPQQRPDTLDGTYLGVGDLDRAFRQALEWLPDHILRVGRKGGIVSASVQPTTDDLGAYIVELPAARFTLGEVLVAAAALMLFEHNEGEPPLRISAPEVNEEE